MAPVVAVLPECAVYDIQTQQTKAWRVIFVYLYDTAVLECEGQTMAY